MNKIIMWIRKINDVIPPSIRGVAVSWIIIICESILTKIFEIYNTKVSG